MKKNNYNSYLLYVIEKFMGAESDREAYLQLTDEKSDNKSMRRINKNREIIEKCYELFLNNSSVRALKQRKSSVKTIYEHISEQILGDNKRKYNMISSDLGLYDENLIYGVRMNLVTPPGKQQYVKRLVGLQFKEDKTNSERKIYKNSQGEEITIQLVNRLVYKDGFGQIRYLNKYVIKKQDSEQPYEVYSIIDMLQMDSNEQYRRVVLDELLSDRNIQLSNAGGFIGIIKSYKGEEGKEKYSGSEYAYQVTDSYELEYSAEHLSAVVAYSEGLNKLHKEQSNSKIEQISLAELQRKYGIELINTKKPYIGGEDR